MTSQIDQARFLIAKAKRPIFFTGAGMSADSGVPTFRDAMTGLWAKYDPLQLATGQAFARDPELVWNFYEYRRGIVRKCAPNAGHHALATSEQRDKRPVTAITQNVDGYQQLAGTRGALCLHGNIMEDRCHGGCVGIFPATEPREGEPVPPVCATCGYRTMRPNVVWFGESLDEAVLSKARDAVHECDVMVVVGTSGVVYPAAGLADLALQLGKPFIEINPEPSPWSDRADVYLRGRSSEVLPQILLG
jgi:NAD-dependent deacetylase